MYNYNKRYTNTELFGDFHTSVNAANNSSNVKSEQIDDLKAQIHKLKNLQVHHIKTIDSLTKELEPARLRMKDLEDL